MRRRLLEHTADTSMLSASVRRQMTLDDDDEHEENMMQYEWDDREGTPNSVRSVDALNQRVHYRPHTTQHRQQRRTSRSSRLVSPRRY